MSARQDRQRTMKREKRDYRAQRNKTVPRKGRPLPILSKNAPADVVAEAENEFFGREKDPEEMDGWRIISSPGTPEHDSASSPEPESLKPRPARLSWGDDEASRQPSRQDRRPSESWSASSRDSRGPETSRHQDPWGQQRSRSLAVDDAPIGRDERWRSNEDSGYGPRRSSSDRAHDRGWDDDRPGARDLPRRDSGYFDDGCFDPEDSYSANDRFSRSPPRSTRPPAAGFEQASRLDYNHATRSGPVSEASQSRTRPAQPPESSRSGQRRDCSPPTGPRKPTTIDQGHPSSPTPKTEMQVKQEVKQESIERVSGIKQEESYADMFADPDFREANGLPPLHASQPPPTAPAVERVVKTEPPSEDAPVGSGDESPSVDSDERIAIRVLPIYVKTMPTELASPPPGSPSPSTSDTASTATVAPSASPDEAVPSEAATTPATPDRAPVPSERQGVSRFFGDAVIEEEEQAAVRARERSREQARLAKVARQDEDERARRLANQREEDALRAHRAKIARERQRAEERDRRRESARSDRRGRGRSPDRQSGYSRQRERSQSPRRPRSPEGRRDQRSHPRDGPPSRYSRESDHSPSHEARRGRRSPSPSSRTLHGRRSPLSRRDSDRTRPRSRSPSPPPRRRTLTSSPPVHTPAPDQDGAPSSTAISSVAQIDVPVDHASQDERSEATAVVAPVSAPQAAHVFTFAVDGDSDDEDEEVTGPDQTLTQHVEQEALDDSATDLDLDEAEEIVVVEQERVRDRGSSSAVDDRPDLSVMANATLADRQTVDRAAILSRTPSPFLRPSPAAVHAISPTSRPTGPSATQAVRAPPSQGLSTHSASSSANLASLPQGQPGQQLPYHFQHQAVLDPRLAYMHQALLPTFLQQQQQLLAQQHFPHPLHHQHQQQQQQFRPHFSPSPFAYQTNHQPPPPFHPYHAPGSQTYPVRPISNTLRTRAPPPPPPTTAQQLAQLAQRAPSGSAARAQLPAQVQAGLEAHEKWARWEAEERAKRDPRMQKKRVRFAEPIGAEGK